MGDNQITNLITGTTGDTATNKTYVDAVNATAITDHGALTGLTDDDHERYFDKDLSKGVTGENIFRAVNNSFIRFIGGQNTNTGGWFFAAGKDFEAPYGGGFGYFVVNGAKTTYLEFMRVSGNTDTPSLNMLAHAITNVKDPVSAQDAVTKNYVDTRSQTYAGNPTNNLVPTAVNYLCIDTTNHNLYIATTALSSGWRIFTRAA